MVQHALRREVDNPASLNLPAFEPDSSRCLNAETVSRKGLRSHSLAERAVDNRLASGRRGGLRFRAEVSESLAETSGRGDRTNAGAILVLLGRLTVREAKSHRGRDGNGAARNSCRRSPRCVACWQALQRARTLDQAAMFARAEALHRSSSATRAAGARPRSSLHHVLRSRRRRAFRITDTELKLIAAAAIIGLRSTPKSG